MLEGIKWLGHSSIKITKDNKVIYVDPFNLLDGLDKADIIFITHSHYDHFSYQDIIKIKKDTTVIIGPNDLFDDLVEWGFSKDKILLVKPGCKYRIDNINFESIPSYNVDKNFHPKDKQWLGYLITLGDFTYYIAGDTDITDENKKVRADVAFLPIGGTFTMDCYQAATLANIIKPLVVIPIHYGSIVGNEKDLLRFKERLDKGIECIILDKESKN